MGLSLPTDLPSPSEPVPNSDSVPRGWSRRHTLPPLGSWPPGAAAVTACRDSVPGHRALCLVSPQGTGLRNAACHAAPGAQVWEEAAAEATRGQDADADGRKAGGRPERKVHAGARAAGLAGPAPCLPRGRGGCQTPVRIQTNSNLVSLIHRCSAHQTAAGGSCSHFNKSPDLLWKGDELGPKSWGPGGRSGSCRSRPPPLPGQEELRPQRNGLHRAEPRFPRPGVAPVCRAAESIKLPNALSRPLDSVRTTAQRDVYS